MVSSLSNFPKAILVHTDFYKLTNQEDISEFKDLVAATGAQAMVLVTSYRAAPDPKYFIGSGKVQEIAQLVTEHAADFVFLNHNLSPSQERNLEKALSCSVVDRVRIILDIFAQRARTFEGKLQVELAQLEHLKTRLVRGWTHLERQRGGIGLRGPGETQLETDRRLIRSRIRTLHARLEKVRLTREQGRRKRNRATLPTVSLIGYTNAGKSTLFNHLCRTDTYVADQLFATLDPILNRLQLPMVGTVIIADTVGFIRHLPTPLIQAFRATLEETVYADLLLHVIDAHDPQALEKSEHVNAVLEQIGADTIPQLWIYNKIDLLDDCPAHTDLDADQQPRRVWLSAQSGEGVDQLCLALSQVIHPEIVEQAIHLAPEQGKLRAQLYELGEVLTEIENLEGGWEIQVRMSKTRLQTLLNQQ